MSLRYIDNQGQEHIIDNVRIGKGSGGNAQPSDVLAEKTFTNDSGEQVGSIPTYQGSNVVYPSQSGTILATNKNYLTSDISVRGDQNFKAENIKKGVKIWNVTGTLDTTPYTPIEYLETDRKYINTNFNGNPKTTKVIYEFQSLESVLWASIFGERIANQANTHMVIYGGNVDNTFFLDWYSGGTTFIPMTVGTKYKFECHNNQVIVNGKVYTGQDNKLDSYLSFPLLLGASNENGTPNIYINRINHRIFSCKIYDNGKLVRDFIPCIMLGNKGLLDKVENKMYYLIP